MSSRETGDVIMLGIGGFTPLSGFMNQADWRGVCDDMRLSNGVFWPIPITLSADEAVAAKLAIGAEVALVDGESREVMATMTVAEKYTIDKAHECQTVFKTTDLAHPGVKMVMEQKAVNIAGPVKVLSQGDFPTKYAGTYMTPAKPAPCSKARAGRRSRPSRPAIPCIARMNIWRKSQSRSATGS